ncbi:MAG: OsmC family protein [Chloroflexi bacterium]|jgi:uncharacterized OsmC-like protein|nr:OsmC family protein [Chloroflexota bacterium]
MLKTEKIQSIWQGGMRVDNLAGDHTLIIDQPANMGGKDEGPNPVAFLLIALGGCLSTMAAIVAMQEKIDLRGFSVEVEGDYDTDFLLGKTQDGRAGFTEIREKVTIDADLTEEEKQAFFEKVHTRCPVTDTIRNQTQIQYEVL